MKLFSPQDAMPKGILDAAVDQVIRHVSTKVLGKRKRKLNNEDFVALDNYKIEVPCDIFDQFRQGKWLDAWAIGAAMHISDRPFFVRVGQSVPLNEFGRDGMLKPVRKPLAGWAGEISTLHQEARGVCRDEGALVHFRPLNHNNNHYTLLEINEREKEIRHYDSMATKDVIEGTAKLTRVGKLVQVRYSFGDKEGDAANAIIDGVRSFKLYIQRSGKYRITKYFPCR
jgi:hypothetical protein